MEWWWRLVWYGGMVWYNSLHILMSSGIYGIQVLQRKKYVHCLSLRRQEGADMSTARATQANHDDTVQRIASGR